MRVCVSAFFPPSCCHLMFYVCNEFILVFYFSILNSIFGKCKMDFLNTHLWLDRRVENVMNADMKYIFMYNIHFTGCLHFHHFHCYSVIMHRKAFDNSPNKGKLFIFILFFSFLLGNDCLCWIHYSTDTIPNLNIDTWGYFENVHFPLLFLSKPPF